MSNSRILSKIPSNLANNIGKILSVNVFGEISPETNYGWITANAAYDQANTGVLQAQAAFASANNVAPQIEPAYNQANTGVLQAQSAFAQANTAYTTGSNAAANTIILFEINETQNNNISLIQEVNNTQNTIINSAFVAANNEPIAKSAFDQANSAFDRSNTGIVQAQAAFTVANNAIANTDILFGINSTQNTTISLIQDVDATQNSTIISAFGQANLAFGQANTGVTQAQASFSQANNAIANTVILFGINATQNSTINIIQGVDTTQNSAISSSFAQANTGTTQAQAAFGQANTGVVQAQAAFGRANLAYGQANAGVVQAEAAFAAANNEPIAKSAFGQANDAFAQANTKFNSSGGTISGDVFVSGNVTIQGTTTTLDVDTLVVKDKNIVLANAASPTDITADGAGLTVLGSTNKTWNWVDATDSWTSSENINLSSGKSYKINGVDVLTATTISNIQGVDDTQNTAISSAFDQANTGVIQAQAAFGQANTGVVQAQAAFVRANSTIILGSTPLYLGGTNTSISGLTLSSPTFTSPALGTPASGNLTNCTFPTLNQNTTGSAATLTTPRTLTIGSTGKTFNGSSNVSWTLNEIGAYANTNPSGYTTNTGTVTSVGGTGTVSGLSLSGTVTTSGNLTLGGTLSVAASNFSSQTANQFLAAPNGTAGVPTFRAIVAADIPTLNQNTTGSAATLTTARTLTIGSTGKTFNGSGNVSWTLGEIGAYAASNPSGYTSNAGTVTSVSGTGTVGGLSLSGTVTSSGSLTLSGTVSVNFNDLTNKGSGTGTYTTSGDYRAPIFYDSNDTGYYIDPNSESRLYKPTYYTQQNWGISYRAVGRCRITGDQNYWTTTIGWGIDYGTWDNYWKYGFGGFDCWGSNTGHPQGSGYIHAQGIQSGLHYANEDGSSGYGWQMVGATNATANRYWARGKWGGSISGWQEFVLSGSNPGYTLYSTILYDSNDTGYYCDPNNTSNMIRWNVYTTNTNNASYGGSLGNEFKQWPGGTGCAGFSFHRSGAYAVNMALDSDNVIRIGGWSASANRLQMDMSGNLTMAGNVTAYSDIRLKENIQIIENPVDKIKQIRGVTFTRNDQDDKIKRHAGVIAQEVEKVLPEVVSDDHEGVKNVAYGNMIGLLIEAIKEQQIQIEQQEEKINSLLNLRG